MIADLLLMILTVAAIWIAVYEVKTFRMGNDG